MNARLQRDVVDEDPSLVVWQVSTNAVWKTYDLSKVAAAIDELEAATRPPTMS
jgi:hypothetical protein